MRYAIMGSTAQAIRAAGGTNISEQKSVGIMYADLSPEQAKVLARRTSVVVTPVRDVKLHVSPPTPVPASLANSMTPESILAEQDFEEWKKYAGIPVDGEGIDIAILDTGIRRTHERLGGMVVYEENFSSSSTAEDVYDHGTGVADIIHTMVPKSKLLNMKVIDNQGQGTEEAVSAAVDRCIEMHTQMYQYAPNFICMSLGSIDDGNPNNPIRVACRKAIDEFNIWIAAAAGNDGPNDNTITCPATERYVCAVGSCSLPDLYIESYSSHGPTKEGLTKPDVVFIGKDVLVASSKDDVAQKAASGTSYATPFIIGMSDIFRQIARAGLASPSGTPYYNQTIPYLNPALQIPNDPTMEQMIDEYCPYVCLKPSDQPVRGHISEKDNTYGYGIPFSTLALKFMSSYSTAAVTEFFLQPVMSIMMLGMMVGMVRPLFSKR